MKNPVEIFAEKTQNNIAKAVEQGVSIETILGCLRVVENVLINQALLSRTEAPESPQIEIPAPGLKIKRNEKN